MVLISVWEDFTTLCIKDYIEFPMQINEKYTPFAWLRYVTYVTMYPIIVWN